MKFASFTNQIKKNDWDLHLLATSGTGIEFMFNKFFHAIENDEKLVKFNNVHSVPVDVVLNFLKRQLPVNISWPVWKIKVFKNHPELLNDSFDDYFLTTLNAQLKIASLDDLLKMRSLYLLNDSVVGQLIDQEVLDREQIMHMTKMVNYNFQLVSKPRG